MAHHLYVALKNKRAMDIQNNKVNSAFATREYAQLRGMFDYTLYMKP